METLSEPVGPETPRKDFVCLFVPQKVMMFRLEVVNNSRCVFCVCEKEPAKKHSFQKVQDLKMVDC